MKLTIRLKLFIGFAILLIVSSLVQALSFLITRQYVLSQINTFQEVQAQKGSSEIKSFFATLQKNSTHLAQVYTKNPQEIKNAIKYGISNNEYLQKITILSPAGREVIKFDVAKEALPTALNYEVISDPFKTALAGKTAISQVYYLDKGGPHLDQFSPIFDNAGRVINVIKMQINVSQLRDELADVRLGKNGYIYVVDKDGRLIAHPSEAFVLERPNLSSRNIITTVQTKPQAVGELYKNEKNISVVARAVKIPDYDWVVIFEQPISEAYGFLGFIQNLFIVTFIISTLLLLLLSFMISRNLTRPLNRLQQSAKQIEEGKINKIAIVSSGDEIESLSHSFSSLIDKLLDREQSLKEATTQLKNANHRLRQLNELKDEFVSIASHELRTPLASVRNYIWMVLGGTSGQLNGQQKQYLERAYISTERLISLVNDMLNVSRIDSGGVSLDVQPTNLPKLAQSVVDELLSHAKEFQVNLVLTPPPADLPEVSADAQKIKEVLVNLIGNSIKFTPANGTVTVSFAENGSMVETTIADTGTGIEPADMPKLFQKFGMIKEAYIADRALQGTGLGLYICKAIVELHKGEIHPHSEGRGKGTKFTFTLPVQQSTS